MLRETGPGRELNAVAAVRIAGMEPWTSRGRSEREMIV